MTRAAQNIGNSNRLRSFKSAIFLRKCRRSAAGRFCSRYDFRCRYNTTNSESILSRSCSISERLLIAATTEARSKYEVLHIGQVGTGLLTVHVVRQTRPRTCPQGSRVGLSRALNVERQMRQDFSERSSGSGEVQIRRRRYLMRISRDRGSYETSFSPVSVSVLTPGLRMELRVTGRRLRSLSMVMTGLCTARLRIEFFSRRWCFYVGRRISDAMETVKRKGEDVISSR